MKYLLRLIATVAAAAALVSCSKTTARSSGIYIGDECVISLKSAFTHSASVDGIMTSRGYIFYDTYYEDFEDIADKDGYKLDITQVSDTPNGKGTGMISILIRDLPTYGNIAVTLVNGTYINDDYRIVNARINTFTVSDSRCSIDITLSTSDGKIITVLYNGDVLDDGMYWI